MCNVYIDICVIYTLIYVYCMYWCMCKVYIDLCVMYVLIYVECMFWFMFNVCFNFCLTLYCLVLSWCVVSWFHHSRYMRPCLQALQCGLLCLPSRWMCRIWCQFQHQCLHLNSSIQSSAWFGYLLSDPYLPIWPIWPLLRDYITGSTRIS